MTVQCSLCGTPCPPLPPGAVLAAVACACGAVGNFEQAPSTAEQLANDVAGLVQRALADGVEEDVVRGVLERALGEVG